MFKLQRAFANEIIAHAKEDAPNECCGILGGVDGEVKKLFRTRNESASPYRYTIDGRDQIRIEREIDQNNWSIVGIYHSHTGSPAYPSPTDVRMASFPPGSGEPIFPGALYLVVSVANLDEPVLRAFEILGGEISEEDIELID